MFGNKVMIVGLGLSPLGLGHFVPVLVPAAAIIFVVGAVLAVFDR